MFYQFKMPPADPAGLSGYVSKELLALSQVLGAPAPSLNLAMLYAQPVKFNDGLIVLADGVAWNPGSGGGYYGYRAGAWRFLG